MVKPTKVEKAGLKIGNMGWINYFKTECKKIDSSGKKKTRKELSLCWLALPLEEKAKYGQIPSATQQPDHSEKNDESPEGEENVEAREIDANMEGESLQTRCSPIRFCRVLQKLTTDQKARIRGTGFGNLLLLDCGRLHLRLCRWLVDHFDTQTHRLEINGQSIPLTSTIFGQVMGICDGGDEVVTSGVVPSLDAWGEKLKIVRGKFCRKTINTRIEQFTSADDEFTITFCLFLLSTILAPTNAEYVPVGYLNPLLDVQGIKSKNWASWCFKRLCNGIQLFKTQQQSNKKSVLSGSILFLQIFYFHSLHLVPPIVDRAVLPIIGWSKSNINKCLGHLAKQGGFDSDKVSFILYPGYQDGPSNVHSNMSIEDGNPTLQQTSGGRKHGDEMNSDTLDSTLRLLVTEVRLLRAEMQAVKTQVAGLVDDVSALKKMKSPLNSNMKDIDEEGNRKDMKKADDKVFVPHLSSVGPSTSHRNVIPADTQPKATESQAQPVATHLVSPQSSKHPILEVSSTNTYKNCKSSPKGKTSTSDIWRGLGIDTLFSNSIDNDLAKTASVDEPYHVNDPLILNPPGLHGEYDKLADHELRSNSSSQLTIMKTRSAGKRKPSQHVLSPYMLPNPSVQRQKKFSYGPFKIEYQLQELDGLLIDYMFDINLAPSEHIVDVDNLQVSRESFRTLEPKKFMNSEIISAAAEFKNIIMQARDMSDRICWYFPTYFQYAILNCKADNMVALKKSLSNFKVTYMKDIDRCERIYIPINDQHNHWFLGIVHIQEKKAELWDSRPPRRKSPNSPRRTQLKRMLCALDIMLGEDIRFMMQPSFSFSNFSLIEPNAPQQPNEYDCGMFVCMFMDDAMPTAEQLDVFDSNCQRLLFARYLALFPGNKISASICEKAKERSKELVDAKLKRKLPARAVAPIKKLSKKAKRHLQ